MPNRSNPVAVCDATLRSLAERGVAVPTYDRCALTPKLAHIGVGGFHRAHLAAYLDELADAESTWGIRGLGLLAQDSAMAEALAPQDHLYTLIERGNAAPVLRVIGSMVDYRHLHERPDAAAEVVADPSLAMLSMTITEAGYGTDAGDESSGTFDVIAGGLRRRRVAGAPPITIVSCDNLPGNGDAARRATLRAAQRLDAATEEWIDRHCTFPNSMVDRITPATTNVDREWLSAEFGVEDRWPVVAEPFRQWVIEDAFAADRPSFEDVGVLVTDLVHEWELYKLRMLNAAHSSMAYLAALSGITYVDEAVDTPPVRAFLDSLLLDEAVPSLQEIPGHPRVGYVESILERFANTGVRDQIARLCIDGSAKFPTFLLPTIAHHLDHGGPIAHATLALAGWARYLAVVPASEQAFDASAEPARRHARRALVEPVRFLEYGDVFPPRIRDDDRFRAEFVTMWRRLDEQGPLQAMASTARDPTEVSQ